MLYWALADNMALCIYRRISLHTPLRLHTMLILKLWIVMLVGSDAFAVSIRRVTFAVSGTVYFTFAVSGTVYLAYSPFAVSLPCLCRVMSLPCQAQLI